MASRINSEIPYSKLNGSMTERVSNNLNYSFLGVNGEDLLIKLDEKGLELSTGSACSTNKKQKASHVLKALGLKYEEINSSIRISLGYQNTIEEIENACDILAQTIKDLRYENSVINK